MIEIGTTDFLIKVPSLSEKELEEYSSRLFDQWEADLEQLLSLDDYSISLQIEEGSISGKAKIAAFAGAVYMGVANYGGFVSGLKTIRDQVSYVNNLLVEKAKQPVQCSDKDVTVKNSGGALTRLQNLIVKVQKGTLTVNDALARILNILGEEAKDNASLVAELKRELESAPRYPQQLNLIDKDENEEQCQDEVVRKIESRKPSPQPEPMNQYLRIEIWRESKKGKKRVKLIKK